jgi:hypothetical protein
MIVKEKRSFLRLLMQILMHEDARELFMNAFSVSDSLIHPGHEPGDSQYPRQMEKMIRDYFIRKKEIIGDKYDPESEINMFIITMKGFAMSYVYMDEEDEIYYEKLVDRIIEIYK